MPFSGFQGHRLFYQLSGEQGPPLVFIHGMWGDHSQFAPQVDRFAARHRVMVPDLLGHGQSDKPEVELSMEGFADGVAALCRHAGLKRVVAVGHSLGGAVAVSLAARHPELVRGAACLDTTLLAPAKAKKQALPAMLARLEGEPPLEALAAWLEPMFLPSDAPEIKQRVLAAVAEAPLHVSTGLIRAVVAWDGQAALERAACPLLYVGGAAPRTPMADLKHLKPAALYGQVVGSGHFMTMIVPEQVNAMLERFMELLPWLEAA
ncbi:MAG: alpha/beta hydrolase [Desulfarculaceae bacterium]|nr:alpha/beta hydrolase [Desulfarculaceae bacterium]MCF8072494.1 alpha/beta hydrolase [Desulfarculaceae bacterium]MCF8102955.1 alpha/beta hydrolase [Desulfarculaceae bacterium]MCF8117035.1 alpha/beta hydrolase [Desulfarculaceae bacterium]